MGVDVEPLSFYVLGLCRSAAVDVFFDVSLCIVGSTELMLLLLFFTVVFMRHYCTGFVLRKAEEGFSFSLSTKESILKAPVNDILVETTDDHLPLALPCQHIALCVCVDSSSSVWCTYCRYSQDDK